MANNKTRPNLQIKSGGIVKEYTPKNDPGTFEGQEELHCKAHEFFGDAVFEDGVEFLPNPQFAASNRARCREYFAHFALRLHTNPADDDAARFMKFAWFRMGNHRGLAEMIKIASAVGVDYRKLMARRRRMYGGLHIQNPGFPSPWAFNQAGEEGGRE